MSGWVESVLKFLCSNTNTNLSISKSGLNFSFDNIVLSKGKSIIFVFSLNLEVQVSDEVLESNHKFVNWSTSLELELEKANSNFSPSSLGELLKLVLEGEFSR